MKDSAERNPPVRTGVPRATVSALLLLMALASPARAGLSFVQVLQAQTDQGEDGIFGKSWVELSGRRMRIVSGYARRVQKDGSSEDPQRVVQLLDLEKKERFLLWPETRSYARVPLADLAYAEGLRARLDAGAPDRILRLREATLEKRPGLRRLLGTDCEHHRLRADFDLVSQDGSTVPARMELDAWTAPISGALSRNLLDLISFENDYRAAAGGTLSPLDHERFQIREAAAYLRAPPAAVRAAVEGLRERLRELPSYPVAVSVAWSRGDFPDPSGPADKSEGSSAKKDLRDLKPLPVSAAPPPAPPKKPSLQAKGRPSALLPMRTAPLRKRAFKRIDWRNSERRINALYEEQEPRRREPHRSPQFHPILREPRRASPPTVRNVYPAFREDYLKTVSALIERMAQEREEQPPAEQEPLRASAESPFYQIYAELHGLERSADVPDKDLSVPAGYVEKPAP